MSEGNTIPFRIDAPKGLVGGAVAGDTAGDVSSVLTRFAGAVGSGYRRGSLKSGDSVRPMATIHHLARPWDDDRIPA
jgi:hypothetical protein